MESSGEFIRQSLSVHQSSEKNNSVQANLRIKIQPDIKPEAYKLQITNNKLKYRLQQKPVLYMLCKLYNSFISFPGGTKLPALTIQDNPSYSWRGAELDVARHFFSKNIYTNSSIY
jgi:hexosaminidase